MAPPRWSAGLLLHPHSGLDQRVDDCPAVEVEPGGKTAHRISLGIEREALSSGRSAADALARLVERHLGIGAGMTDRLSALVRRRRLVLLVGDLDRDQPRRRQCQRRDRQQIEFIVPAIG